MLKEKGSLTAMEIKENGLDVNSSQLTYLVSNGYATAKKVEITVMVPVKRIVNLYTYEKDFEKESE